MEASPDSVLAAANSAWDMLVALAVAYSFSVIGAIIILIVGWIIAGLAERGAYRAMGATRHIDETIKTFISKLLRYGILVLVMVTVLSQFGVQTTSIIAALGAAGLAIGLALQGTLQNIAAGLMLLFLRPFRVGEYIDNGDVSGTVKEIGLFATELRTFDGLFVLAPNSSIWGTPIKNFSRNTDRRADFTVGIGYDDDVELAKSTLMDMLTGDSRVYREPAPAIFVTELAASSVNINLRYWSTSGDYERLKSDMTANAKRLLEAQGITLPFPQQDVHHYMMEEEGGDPGQSLKMLPKPGNGAKHQQD